MLQEVGPAWPRLSCGSPGGGLQKFRSRYRSKVNLPHRNPRAIRSQTAGLKLGGRLQNSRAKPPHLDHHFPEPRGNGNRLPVEREPAGKSLSHAERAGLFEQYLRKAVGIRPLCNHGQKEAWSPLFHLRGCCKDIERAL